MKRRIISAFTIPFLLLVLTAMAPLSVLASGPSAGTSSQQRVKFFLHDGQTKTFVVNSRAAFSNNLVYGSGPVMGGTTNVYAIFWQPTNNVSSTYHSLIQRYFNDVGGSSLYRNNTQYPDSGGNKATGARLAASWTDTAGYPESPLLDSDIQNEVSHAQATNGWSSSIHNIFFVFTQANQDICFDNSYSQCASNAFCAYHSYFGSNTIYGVMPYAYSFSCNGGRGPNNDQAADETINVTSHEQMEAATDPLLGAWLDNSGYEIGDKCAWTFGHVNSNHSNVTWNGHLYLVQREWDNRVGGCVLSGP